MYRKIGGIYEIRNIINGHRYIGSSTNIKCRWNEHKRRLRKGEHHSVYLQRAWNKYGESSFAFGVLCPILIGEDRISREQEYMDNLKPEYNIAPRAISPGGFVMTEVTRNKHRQNGLRMAQNPEWREKIAKTLREKALPAANLWHKTKECREWAKINYSTSLAPTHVDRLLICIQCGKEYWGEKGKFCSGNCQSKWRREHGVDNEARNCICCGKEFIVNKYYKTLTCSKSCSQSQSIIQVDMDGNVLNKYKNAQLASDEIGIEHSSICKCIRGEYNQAGGFIWRYANNNQSIQNQNIGDTK